MVKVVKEYDVAEEIMQSNMRRQAKGLRRIELEDLHSNQKHELAQHLKHDTAHRMLPHLRANPRSPRPIFVEDRTQQILNPPKAAAEHA